MKTSACGLTAAAAAALPVHMLLILAGGAAGLILLVYLGIALPAVWSAKADRRRAATAVLRLILDACTHPAEVGNVRHRPRLVRRQTTPSKRAEQSVRAGSNTYASPSSAADR